MGITNIEHALKRTLQVELRPARTPMFRSLGPLSSMLRKLIVVINMKLSDIENKQEKTGPKHALGGRGKFVMAIV